MESNFKACDLPMLWIDYVNKGEIDKLVALYNTKAILMPTFSPHFVKNEKELRNYFTQLASREELQVRIHDKTMTCLQIHGESYVANGIYSFEFKVDDTVLTFPSRFTFVIDTKEKSPILHHHSSQIPRTLG